jgi:hypothetical protein
MSNCTCGSVDGTHEPGCPAYVGDTSGPLLLEDILNAKSVLVFVAVLTILALVGFLIVDPMGFFG